MSFTLKQLRYFLAAADAGQISRAAIEFNVSQSAVTGALQQLEGLLGMELFQRRSNGVVLTSAGARFLNHARSIVNASNEALRMSSHAAERTTGGIRVAVTYTVAGYFLAPLLMRFRRIFPEIQVELREADRDTIEADIMKGSGEIALILTSNLRHREHLDHETLLRSHRRLWLPTEHPLLQRESIGLRDVSEYPYIALTVDEALHTAQRYWEGTSYRPNVIFSTSSVEAVRTMVAAGMGITILSDLIYRPWSLEGQRLETRDVVDEIPSMDVGVAWKKGAEITPPTEAFIDFLIRTFREPSRPMHITLT